MRSRVCADVSTKPQEKEEEEKQQEEEGEEERFSQTARGQSSLGCCSTAGHRGLKMKKIFPAKKRIRKKSPRNSKNGRKLRGNLKFNPDSAGPAGLEGLARVAAPVT